MVICNDYVNSQIFIVKTITKAFKTKVKLKIVNEFYIINLSMDTRIEMHNLRKSFKLKLVKILILLN